MTFDGARLRAAAVAVLGLMGCSAGASAQSVEDFYKGRKIDMVIYTTGGSSYDLYARLLITHMGRFIPGSPSFVPRNMLGAGGLKAAEYIYRLAPKDGATIGTVGRGIAFDPFLGKNDVNLDPLKFVWLGSMNRETSLAFAWGTHRVKSLADLQKHELLVPGTGAGADSEIMPIVYNSFAGTKFKIIKGYTNTVVAALSVEKGELDGIAYWGWSGIRAGFEHWVTEKKINFLFHTGEGDHPAAVLKGVPSIRTAVKDPIDLRALEFVLAREVLGRPFMAPPDIPADRAKALRDAFIATMKDPEFQADAAKRKLDVELVTGAEVNAVLRRAADAPKEAIDRVKAALASAQ